ncbi:hypothetical protein CIHG_09247 [Coccidioides immitis H538.4]|uniref:Mediator of RNA polymerase II transcription subunit 10 n=1 Tax=Coccidioides immitis H538.4 TaxID=396776 RepID=A0A0J8S263_COCIT|nr:hypothetical protein CIHG_09247 [Coccidioides immitis H538.4]
MAPITLSQIDAPDPSYVQSPPSRTGLSPADPPVQSIQLPPEIIDYVDAARNPDIYTREFVELVQKSNQELKGKMEAFASFRDVLAKEMASAMPECKTGLDILPPPHPNITANEGWVEFGQEPGDDGSPEPVSAEASEFQCFAFLYKSVRR